MAQRASAKGFSALRLDEFIVNSKLEDAMQQYKCTICGYIYDPEKGDPDNNIPANTPFEKLPDDWACPLCGAPKDMFEPA